MAVKVTVLAESGVSTRTDVHDEGTGIGVDDGHLKVTKSGTRIPKTIAIYAPKTWRSAVVEGGDQ